MFLELFRGLNAVFSLTMFFAFGFSFVLLFSEDKTPTRQNFLNAMPSLLTSVGIFGTFFGIVLALQGFDTANIRGSIDTIIAGMKTAFITSVLGIFLSLILKVLIIWFNNDEIDNAPEERQNRNILRSFMEQTKNSHETVNLLRALHSNNQQMNNHLLTLSQNMSTQNQTISTWQNNWHTAEAQRKQKMAEFEQNLTQQLNDFAEILSKSATEQIIDALRQVIKDFNNKITEQFGDNFKQLNEAVGNLLQWQENYKQQLAKMSEQYTQGVRAISQTEQALDNIATSAKSIPTTMSNLGNVMRINQHQINELERHLAAFAEIRNKAVAALPEIKQLIEDMLNNMDSGSQQITNAANNFEVGANQIRTSLTQAANQFASNLSHSQKTFEEHCRNIQAAVNENITKTIAEITKRLQDEAKNGLTRTGESINKQLEAMDEAMQKELNRVMETMGGHLLTMINQFTRDYKELVDKMNEIIRYK